MAERANVKQQATSRSTSRKGATRGATKAPAKKAGSATKTAPKSGGASLQKAIERLEAEIESLRQERDKLKTALAAEQKKSKALEEAHDQAVNRIDWVIDSLHNVIQDKT